MLLIYFLESLLLYRIYNHISAVVIAIATLCSCQASRNALHIIKLWHVGGQEMQVLMKLNVLITSYAVKYNRGALMRGRGVPVCGIQREHSTQLKKQFVPSSLNPETALIVP